MENITDNTEGEELLDNEDDFLLGDESQEEDISFIEEPIIEEVISVQTSLSEKEVSGVKNEPHKEAVQEKLKTTDRTQEANKQVHREVREVQKEVKKPLQIPPKKSGKPRVGITMGDFNGIGAEIIIKLLNDKRITNHCVPIVYGSGKILTKYKRMLDMDDFDYHQYNQNSYLNEKKANVINCWADNIEIEPGKMTKEAGRCAYLAIQKATEDLKAGFIDAVVTCPIHKANIQHEDFQFAGHTEYYTAMFSEGKDTLMMLCSDQMKIGTLTGHIPLSEVKKYVTKERLMSKLNVMMESLKNDFGIIKPRIAVLGLNPHAGEEGLLGTEEQEIIHPVIVDLHKRGHLVFGPYPADGFFGTMAYRKFDAVLAMYHDQGLIPFKFMSFENGVNFTAGLPIVRTSPDHGTAYDIAGKNKASESSLREALYMAIDIVNQRANKIENQIRYDSKEFKAKKAKTQQQGA
jgi:4-hydroxythreonine-4-phosphate dehydrogenase